MDSIVDTEDLLVVDHTVSVRAEAESDSGPGQSQWSHPEAD